MVNNEKTVSDKGIRESNFELLRLVCMFFVLLHHFICHGLVYSSESYLVPLNGFFIIAVNCFVLISGYFGIRISWRGFFHLYIFCVFYNLLFSFIQAGSSGDFVLETVLYSFLPFSHTGKFWFIACYFYLFLLSPMLNKIIDKCNKKEFIAFLIICAIVNLYFGYLWKKPVNYDGYNVMNFIFLYFIGRFVALHTTNITTLKRRLLYIGIYVLCSVSSILFLLSENPDTAYLIRHFYAYNAPLVYIATISFFLFFRTLSFKSKIVNWAAGSALAVYLIHENGFVRKYLYDYINKIGADSDIGWLLDIYLLIVAIVLFIICILIDKIRLLITNPIEKSLNKIKWNIFTNRLIEKIARIVK